MYTRPHGLLSKMSLDKHHVPHYLGARWKSGLLGLLNLSLHFNETPGSIQGTFQFAQHCHGGHKTRATLSGSGYQGPESNWQTRR